jgi:hypothetical protein
LVAIAIPFEDRGRGWFLYFSLFSFLIAVQILPMSYPVFNAS